MQSHKTEINQYRVTSSTDMAITRGESCLARALKYLSDPDKKRRVSVINECKTCYYLSRDRIGGAAITTKPCGICDKEMNFGSTCTDVICRPCGEKHELCVYCGGDLHMRPRRKFNLQKAEDKDIIG